MTQRTMLDRITFDPRIMGGKPCARGMRMPVSVVLKSMAGGMSKQQILEDYPYLHRRKTSTSASKRRG